MVILNFIFYAYHYALYDFTESFKYGEKFYQSQTYYVQNTGAVIMEIQELQWAPTRI